MKYRITGSLTITVHDDGTFDENEACNLLAIAGGLEHDEPASRGSANVFTGQDGTRYWIPKNGVIEPDYSEYVDMIRVHPLRNMAFAQALLFKMAIQVSPVAFHDGNLVGLWRADYTPGYGAGDYATYGWPHGAEEPISEQSQDIVKAICMAAMRISGFGRKAYLLNRPGEEMELIFISDQVSQWVVAHTDDAEYLIAIPELDEYAITGISYSDADEIIKSLLKDVPLPAPQNITQPTDSAEVSGTSSEEAI